MAELNTYDLEGVVHGIKIRPSDTYRGTTDCGLSFTLPIYGALTGKRWTGTHDHITCISCIGRR